MPAAVAIPLVSAAIGAGTTIVGAKMGANASRRAGDIQARAADQALGVEREQLAYDRAQNDWRRSQYDRAMQEYEGWRTGPQAQALNTRLGLPSSGPSAPPVSRIPPASSWPPFSTTMPMPRQTVTMGELMASSSKTPARYTGAARPEAVPMRQSNGDTRLVPIRHVSYYERLGAKRV